MEPFDRRKSMKLTEHDILQRIGPILLSPRVIPSRAELARRAKLTDDMLLRFANGFELERGFALLEMENGKVKLTEKGRLAYELYSQLWSLGDAEDCAKQTLKLQVEPIVGALLSGALVAVFDLWGSAIDRPSIWRLDCDIRRSLAEKKADLGLGFADADETVGDAEAVGAPVQWCVLAPAGHRLGETQEPVPVDQLTKEEWLLLPDLAFGAVGLADSFVRAGHRQVMECDHLTTYVVAKVGLAVLPDVLGRKCPHGTIKRRLVGLPPIQVRLFLPRGGEGALSSANQCLIENLRRLVREGLLGGDNGATASAAPEAWRKQEMPEAEQEDVVEDLLEETVTPMAEVLS
jgi:DNA-binding transcriptional LysR family regulator